MKKKRPQPPTPLDYGFVLACFVLIAAGLALFVMHSVESSHRSSAPCEGSALCAPFRLAPNGGFLGSK